MSNWLAVHWDKNQLLLLLARVKQGKLFLEKAIRIHPDLETISDSNIDLTKGENTVTPHFKLESVKTKLRHFVQQERLGKCDTVLVLGRDEVEVRSMIFPPVPNDELPEMARFQAAKDFTEYEPSAALDFVLFDGARKDKKHLLAATLPRAKYEAYESIVTGAGLSLERVVLGPCEAAQRFATVTVQQKTGGAGKTTLLTEINELSATLTLLYRGKPAFIRTLFFPKSIWEELEKTQKMDVTLPEELDRWKWLTAEIKRTIVAAINEVPSEKIDELVLCGAGERFDKLKVIFEETVSVPVSIYNVWRFEIREGEIKNHLPVFEEQFLSLIGALSSAALEKPNVIDFKNPKKKPEKKSNKNTIVLAFAAAFVLYLSVAGYGYYRRVSLEEKIKELTSAKNNETEKAQKAESLKRQTDAIDAWQRGNVNWLTELNWLSMHIPGQRDALLTDLVLRLPTNAGNNSDMKFRVNTRDLSIGPTLEADLRDEKHAVKSPQIAPISKTRDSSYTHSLDLTITLLPEKPKRAVASTAAPPKKTNAATTTPVVNGGGGDSPATAPTPSGEPLNTEINAPPNDTASEGTRTDGVTANGTTTNGASENRATPNDDEPGRVPNNNERSPNPPLGDNTRPDGNMQPNGNTRPGDNTRPGGNMRRERGAQ